MKRTGILGRLGLAAALLLAGFSATLARADDRARAILVLDASGSMWGQIDGKAKWDIARAAVDRLVTGWDPAIDLGLTVYGHRTKGSCDDIEDVMPVGPVDPAKLKAAIAKISPKGKTPLTAAVRRAAEALKYTENAATVILVSDGEETCDLDPCAIASELEARGVGFTAHVIGFDIRDEAAKAQLKCIADNTGGTFVLADDAASLQNALTAVAAATAAPTAAPTPT
ncbi:vWA domain-containing protein, partial [Zavarzinia sp.]|uniref:vWA domain-containing protein n=1 Tax=Zavarzinia sp. TaxID=2027920 RepID=UPI003BB7F2A9